MRNPSGVRNAHDLRNWLLLAVGLVAIPLLLWAGVSGRTLSFVVFGALGALVYAVLKD